MAARGHELGNHTLFHPCNGDKFDWVKPEYDLNGYTLEQLIAELKTANSLLKAVDGRSSRTFAYTCTDYSIDGVSFIDSIRGLFPSARGGGEAPATMGDVDIHGEFPKKKPPGRRERRRKRLEKNKRMAKKRKEEADAGIP